MTSTYFRRSSAAISSIDTRSFREAAKALDAVRDSQRPVWVVGNGGSLAAAQHLVLHLRQAGFEAVDMMSDAAWLSAESNDLGFHGALFRGFRHYAPPGAIVLISGSGNSINCVDVARHYKDISETKLIGLLGMGGGRLLDLCDVSVLVGSMEYGPVEDAHLAIIHALAESFDAPIFGPMSE